MTTTEIVSTHDKIRENWLKMTGQRNDAKKAKEIEAKQVSQLDRIEMVLQSLVDKVAALDLIVRQPYQNMRQKQKSQHDVNKEQVAKAILETKVIDGQVYSNIIITDEPPPDAA